MANPTTRTELKNYCLRRLGYPVVDINVDEDQLQDRIDDALEYYRDYHYDGTEKVYLKHVITTTDVTNEYISIPATVTGIIGVFDIGDAVNTISKHLKVNAIVVMTESGATARVVSHYRPKVNIYGMSPYKYICNRMSLLWGVVPIKTENFITTDDMLKNIEKILIKDNYLKEGQTFVFTAGIPLGVSGSTNMLKIHTVRTK